MFIAFIDGEWYQKELPTSKERNTYMYCVGYGSRFKTLGTCRNHLNVHCLFLQNVPNTSKYPWRQLRFLQGPCRTGDRLRIQAIKLERFPISSSSWSATCQSEPSGNHCHGQKKIPSKFDAFSDCHINIILTCLSCPWFVSQLAMLPKPLGS